MVSRIESSHRPGQASTSVGAQIVVILASPRSPSPDQIEPHRVNGSSESHAVLSGSAATGTTTLAGHSDPCRSDDSTESWTVTSALAAITSVSLGHIEASGIGDSAESRAGIESEAAGSDDSAESQDGIESTSGRGFIE